MSSQENHKYKPLEISYVVTDEIQEAIDELLNHINNEDGMSEDYYRMEIDFWLKRALEDGEITDNQFHELKSYYVVGDIYDEIGHPWNTGGENNNG